MADMSDMLKNFASMMEGKEIPGNVKEMLSSLSQNSNNTSQEDTANSSNNLNNDSFSDSRSGNTQMPNIDIDTMLKMQKIMSSLNNSRNSSGANLLRALKPYLRPNRQAKVDEYINLLGVEQVIGLMNNQNGGDKK